MTTETQHTETDTPLLDMLLAKREEDKREEQDQLRFYQELAAISPRLYSEDLPSNHSDNWNGMPDSIK